MERNYKDDGFSTRMNRLEIKKKMDYMRRQQLCVYDD
jgi:hypothetical protein